MKPHPSIFEAALELLGVSATESVMVGDSLTHDIVGARQVGMQGVLIARAVRTHQDALDGVPVIQTLEGSPACACPAMTYCDFQKLSNARRTSGRASVQVRHVMG